MDNRRTPTNDCSERGSEAVPSTYAPVYESRSLPLFRILPRLSFFPRQASSDASIIQTMDTRDSPLSLSLSLFIYLSAYQSLHSPNNVACPFCANSERELIESSRRLDSSTPPLSLSLSLDRGKTRSYSPAIRREGQTFKSQLETG